VSTRARARLPYIEQTYLRLVTALLRDPSYALNVLT
jgi:hypothetical protein